MKKSILFTLCMTALFACKKEGGSGKQLYLSKIFINDLLSEEYIYASDMKAVRRNRYNTSQGQSNFAGFRIYEYENGLLSRMLQYNKEGELNDKRLFLYNASKKLTRIEAFGNDETMDWYWIYEYDNNQQLSKIIMYAPAPVKKMNEWQLSLNAQNNLVSMKRYYLSNGNLVLSDSAHFTHTDKTIPAHWQLYEEYLQDFPVDKTLECITASSFYYYFAGGPPITSTHTFTQKTYNGQGYITSQQYKLEANNGLGTTTTNYNLKYEYIE